VSLVAIVSIRSAKHPAENQEPGLLANADAGAELSAPDEVPKAGPSHQFKVVPTAAIESDDNTDHLSDSANQTLQTADGSFVEQVPGTVPAGNFRSPRFGYQVTLGGTRWMRWSDLSAIMPDAEFGALLKNYGRFLVMPVQLADADASPESVDRTLLAHFGFQYPNLRSTDLETFTRWGADVQVFRISRDISGRENVYRIWILRRDRNAYLVAAWIDRTALQNSLAAPARSSNSTHSAAPPIDDEKLDAEIDSQLDAVIGHFKLNDTISPASQSGLNQWQPLRHLVHSRIFQAVFQR
jgi:hypothetical protein